MALIREIQEPAFHATFLEHIEQGNAFCYWKPEVLVAVDDEMRGAELLDVFGGRRIEAAIVAAIVPEGAVELLLSYHGGSEGDLEGAREAVHRAE